MFGNKLDLKQETCFIIRWKFGKKRKNSYFDPLLLDELFGLILLVSTLIFFPFVNDVAQKGSKTLSINKCDTKHNGSVVMHSVIYAECRKLVLDAERRGAKKPQCLSVPSLSDFSYG
jgi:hypothetical protein